jgi:ketosteroid isomerase-like protein
MAPQIALVARLVLEGESQADAVMEFPRFRGPLTTWDPRIPRKEIKCHDQDLRIRTSSDSEAVGLVKRSGESIPVSRRKWTNFPPNLAGSLQSRVRARRSPLFATGRCRLHAEGEASGTACPLLISAGIMVVVSQENVDVFRAYLEAWNARDLDALRELLDPDVIVRTEENWPERGPYLGREAVMRFFEQVRGAWDAEATELISDFIDVGDRVAVRYIWRGAGYGPAANLEMTHVTTVRKGKILAIEYFWNHAEALETMGVSEQDTQTDSV